MARNVKVVVLHLAIRLGSKRYNLKRLQETLSSILSRLSRWEVDAVMLPQYPLTGPIIGYTPPERVPQTLRSSAERLQPGRGGSGFTVNTLSRLAGEYGVSIIGGPLVERAGPWMYLSMFYISDRGIVEGRYRKIILSPEERRNAIGRGSTVGIFDLPGGFRVGVFADHDILSSEIFRSFQLSGVNLLVGTLLPFRGMLLPVRYESNFMRPEKRVVYTLAESRSFETGLPLILVGGIVEDSNGNYMLGYSDTIVVDPAMGVISNYTRGVDDPNSHVIVEVDQAQSRPRPCDESCETAIKALCKARMEWSKKKSGARNPKTGEPEV